MSVIRSSLLYSFTSQYLNKALSFCFIVITARLLTPEELGLYAIASAIVVVITEFRLLGTGNFLIRSKDVDIDLVRRGLGLTVLICWSMGIALLGISKTIADYYQLKDLFNLFLILAIPFFLAPFISITASIMTRNMQFKRLMYINLSALTINISSSILLINFGFGFYSLAWGVVFSTTYQFFVYYYFKDSVVSWIPKFNNLKPIIGFGIYNAVINLLIRFETSAPDMIIGKLSTTRDVAMFSRGSGLLMFINETITSGVSQVALPILSKLKRDGVKATETYTKASLLMGGLVMPVLAVAGICAEPLILLVFGDQWREAIPIAQVLCLWMILRTVHALANPLLIAHGYERALLIKQSIVFIICVCLSIISINIDISLLPWAMVAIGFCDLVAATILLWIKIEVSPLHFAKAVSKNFLIAFVCSVVTGLINLVVGFETNIPAISIAAVALIVPFIWFFSLLILKHPLKEEILSLVSK